MRKLTEHRTLVQLIAAVFLNGYLIGFAKGKIFTGPSKVVCVPVLNCYSCPGALGACPIGALQAVLGDHNFKFSFYVLGFIMLFGVLFGRFICGFLCPFGLFQDLLYKIKLKKISINEKIDQKLRYLKYVFLGVFVIVLPLFLTNQYSMGAPYFCEFICPAGTLQAGIPLIATNTALRSTLGFLFQWKMLLLIAVTLLSIKMYRPFCKYLCPLGALYSLFNKFSFYQMDLDKSKCIGCKQCERACKMDVKITENINSRECIMCGECVKACDQGALTSGFLNLEKEDSAISNS